ncbi:golgi-body localization protein domain-containing protein [Halteromyces radiatus]|uniref:golgi-body localization protein domain-containing protein n=1 Tax=Halteromyces radiatus TaxID=101107 RepID=UPI00221EB931|nr:golgi-body localization protein domain-containing protein [Halteromyces radiatus]KAI8100069.1 golgi-body localization protein domain-containing protein [Halteromyces radiatus]
MSLSIYHYVIILTVFLLIRLLLRWIIALCFQLKFGQVGFFSVSQILYRKTTKDASPIEKYVISIGRIKFRIKRPTSSLSTAWITLHIEKVECRIPNWSILRLSQTDTNSQTTLSRRISRMGNLPHIPWWYSISVVKYIVKFTSALPAQFLMAGLANYFDVQINGLLLAIENKNVFKIDHINLSSILFAAVVQQNKNSQQNNDIEYHTPSSSSIYDDSDIDQHHPFLNAGHQRHSLKRAQHLFKEKFFEIILQLGPISIGNQGLELPQGGRIAISCHLSAGCLTLKDVDTSLHVDSLNLRLEKLLELQSLIQQSDSNHHQQDHHSSQHQNRTKNKQHFILDMIRSTSISISHIRASKEYHNGNFLGFDIDYINATTTISQQLVKSQAIGSFCNLQIEMEHAYCFISEDSSSKGSTRLVTLPEVNLTGMFPMIQAHSGGSIVNDGNIDGPNQQSVQANLIFVDPLLHVNMDKISLLNTMVSSSSVSSNEGPPSIQAFSGSIKKQLPKLGLLLKLENPSIHFFADSDGHDLLEEKECSLGVVQWSTILMNVTGEYVLQNDIPSSLLSCNKQQQCQQEESTDKTSGIRKRKGNGMRWTKLFKNTWRFRRQNDASDNQKQVNWIYNATTRVAIHDMELMVKTGNSVTRNPLFSIQSVEVAFGACIPTLNTDDGFVMVVWNLKGERNEVDVNISCLSLFPCVTVSGKHGSGLVLGYWLNIIEQLQQIRPKKTSPPHSLNKPSDTSRKINVMIDTWLRWFRINLSFSQLKLVLEGFDKGKNGDERQAPHGYIDNAPTQDIYAIITTTIDHVSFIFHGDSHKLDVSSGDFHHGDQAYNNESTGTTTSTTAGSREFIKSSLQGTIQSLKVVRSFSSRYLDDNRPDDLILWIPRLSSMLSIVSTTDLCILHLTMVIKQLGLHFTVTNHYALLLALYTLGRIKTNLHLATTRSSEIVASRTTAARWWKMEKVQVQLNRLDGRITLPNDVGLFVRVIGMRMEIAEKVQPVVRVRNTTIYGVAVKDDTKWDQLLELDNLQYSMGNHQGKSNQPIHQLDLTKFYLRVPYRYVIADLVDNGVNLVKYLKAMDPRLSGAKPFTYFGSILKNEPLSLPMIRLHCDKITMQLEDDPLETKLRRIWRTGLVEQRSRLDVLDAFEAKARTEGQERVHQARQRLNEHNSNNWMKHINLAIQQETIAFENLRSQDFRTNGILVDNVGIYSDDKRASKYSITSEDSITAQLFDIDVIDLPRCFSLLDFTILASTLNIRPPDFPLDQTRKFVHDIGKGVPLDTDFTTLAPFHLDWCGGETWAQLRDYPIPFFHVSSGKDNEESKAWTLSGDYVFGDQAGDLDSTRVVKVSILEDHDVDLFYTMDAVRVASPPKFYSVVNIDVHTPKLTSICWCVPYQPAIQDLARTMDTFTRPPIDPSSKVGLWDKIRLMIHTQTTISFIGGGDLALVMKGSRDPYDLTDRGFGLAKLWKKNVVWRMGHNNPQGEFMQIISQDLLFGVPDLVNGGYRVPHLLLPCEEPSISGETNLLGVPHQNINNNNNNNNDNNDASTMEPVSIMGNDDITKNEFLKVALRFTGGIRMGLGCHLERLCVGDCAEDHSIHQERCRLLHFVPHYKVKYKSRQAVDALKNHGKDYDAFAGFRSDFIHFSISIIKLTEKEYNLSNLCHDDAGRTAMNSLHLSPGFLDHFLSTFRLFGGNMSYPLRTGSLYPPIDTRPPKKFGAHMQSMKYKVVVNPIRIGYFYKDDNLVDGGNAYLAGHGDTVGLKGHVKTFSVDLHQQRERTTIKNGDNTSGIDQPQQQKPGWQINEAEVELRNIDLRVVKARYSVDQQMDNNHDHDFVNTNDTIDSNTSDDDQDLDPDFMDGTDRCADENEEDSTWMDMDDFVELNVVTPESIPKVHVLPFAFSPCMYYIKQNNPDDVEKYRYLRGTHDCIIGTAPDTREIQLSLLKERTRNIDIQIRKHQTRLNNVERKLSEKIDDQELLNESKTIVEKTEILFEKRNLLQRYLRELSSDVLPGGLHDSNIGKAAHSDSTIFGEDAISKWEEKMGHFKVRYIVHNPQIIWNNSVRNIVYHFMDLQAHKRALSYYMSSRAVKFLRDVTKKHQKQRRFKKGQYFVEDDDDGLDQETIQQLLEQLVAEKNTKFYAQNEMETPPSTGIGGGGSSNGFDNVDVNTFNDDNVKNPDRQLESIPNGYSMKSSYLIDLLNPQVSLQSDCDPDNLVLMSNERVQAKAFNITEDKETDLEMQLVKNRTIVSLDNTQFFVAKKEQFDTVDLLLDNHYGAKGHEHWLTWIPSEMLISYVKRSDKFQRVGTQLSPTIQIDKYNGLRLKTHSTIFARYHPFEERCDSVHLNFPNLALTADSAQYNAIYEVVVDLLLYKEPAKKERSERLHEIMMAADQGSLDEATENIVELQHRVRHCMGLRDQYQQNIGMLDQDHLEELRKIRLALQDSCEDLYLGMEAFKMLQTNKRNEHTSESAISWKFVFSAAKLSWEMRIDSETPLCEWNLNDTTFTLINKDDHSHTNTVEVGLLQVKNTSANPVYTDVLLPFIEQRNRLPDFSRHKMLRCYLEALAPVGGIPVIQHLEINLFPLRLQMTYDFGKAMASYLFPPERRQKETQQSINSTTVPTSSSSSHNNNNNNNVNLPSNASISGSCGGGGSDANSITSDTLQKSASANLELKDKDSSNRHKYGYPRSATVENIRSVPSTAMDIPMPSNASTGATSIRDTLDTATIDGGNMDSGGSPIISPTPPHSKATTSKRKQKEAYLPDDLSVMKKRASGNRTFIVVKIPGLKHCLTYKGPKEKNIEDLRDFAFQQPYLEYRNKTWSWFELLSNIKRDFMRAALVHNSRALLKEKLTIRRHPRGDTLPGNSNGMADSQFLLSTLTPITMEISPRQSAYDWEDDASGDSDSEDMDHRDDISLHSATSYDNDLDSTMTPSLEHKSTIASQPQLSWTNKFRRKIAVKPEVPEHTPSSCASIETLVKKTKHDPVVMEELMTKGRLLLGKHYQGPTTPITSSSSTHSPHSLTPTTPPLHPENIQRHYHHHS